MRAHTRPPALALPIVGLAALLLADGPAAADGGRRVDLIFAADLAGDFYAQDCGESAPRPAVGLGALAGAIAIAKGTGAAAAAEERPPSLVIGAGGLLGPAAGARFLMHSVDGSRVASELMRLAGIEVVAPGVQELEIARETLLTYLGALRESGPAPLVSNLTCPPTHSALCRAVTDEQMVTRGEVRLGLLAALPEDAPARVGPGHLHGAKVAPWSGLTAAAKRLRPRVDVLVVALDLSSRYGLDAAIGLARTLDAAGARPDVIHVTRQDDPRGGVMAVELTGPVLLVGSPAHGGGVTRVAVTMGATAGAPPILHAERIASPRPPPVPSPLGERLAAERQRMCEGFSAQVAMLPAAGLDRAAVTRLVLDAMRDVAHAEIALINSGAIAEGGLPLRTATVHDVGNLLPFRAQVVAANLAGKDLTDALEKYAGQKPEQLLRIAGLTKKGDELRVNGRPLNVTEKYRVATIDFLAAGGNGLLPDKFMPLDAEGKPEDVVAADLRQVVLDFLRRRGDPASIVAPLPLASRPLWRVMADLGVDLQNVSVRNPGAVYDRPQLVRQPSVAFKIDATARAELDQPRHLVQLTFRTLYGQSWLRTSPDPAGPQSWIGQETADLINLLALYSYRGFSEGRSLLPTPYVSVGLESEWNRPATRSYYHFELSGATGLRLALPAGISANLGIGVRSELLADANSSDATESELAHARFLVTTTIEMPKRALWPRLGSALLGELLLNYNFTDPMLLRSHELRLLAKLYVALGRPLYLTVGTELYLYRDHDNEAGVSLDLTAGLKVVLNGHRQQF